MDRLYVDTSALLCVLLGEKGHKQMVERFANAELLSSTLLVIEAQRNLICFARTSRLRAQQVHEHLTGLRTYLQRFRLRELTLDLCLDPTMPSMSTPRSLDLVHLRTALWFHRQQPLAGYMTLDDVQLRAARELGLSVA